MSKKFNLILSVSVLVILIIICLVGILQTDTGEPTNYTAAEAVSILENAESIEIHRNYRTLFKRDYAIIVNGENVATVEGKYVKLFGDVFTLKSSGGEVIAKEEEEVFHLTRHARFYGAAGNEVGLLKSKFFTILSKDTFYNNNGDVVARCDEKFSIPAKYLIHDGSEDKVVFYEANKTFWFDNYTISVENNEKLDAYNAVLIICIEDAVHKNNNNSSNNKSSSKK